MSSPSCSNHTRRTALAIVGAVAALLAGAGSAHAQATPTAPASGARITDDNVVLRWAPAPGGAVDCVQWSARPEAAYTGGPFLAPDGSDCSLEGQSVAWLMTDLTVGRYYWHVRSSQTEVSDDSAYGPTAYFDVVPPPLPRGCTTRAAKALAEAELYPYLRKLAPDFYTDETLDRWPVAGPICRDLTGDGDREMIIRLPGGTGGATSPWAIFKHDQSGAWHMAYVRGNETVWRLRVVNRRVRARMPAPYEGACTRYTREREVRYSGGRFRSKLLDRKGRGPGC
jgi:hypothetical protein